MDMAVKSTLAPSLHHLNVAVKRLSEKATLPTYGSEGAAGMDLYSAEKTFVPAGKRVLIKTNIAMAIPLNYELQIRPRSGLAFKQGITVLNSPGTIDSDYRGDIGIILYNTGIIAFDIDVGDRIAQGVLCPVLRAAFKEVEDLDGTTRGEGGFGSTGVRS